ncbi:MAG: replication initiation protein [Endozoicomonas sp.]
MKKNTNGFVDPKHLVYKSNELIEAQYKLSAAAQKVAAVLISKIDPNDPELPVFDLSVTDYAKLMGVSKQAAYKLIDKTTYELKQIVITLRKPGSASYTRLGMFRECHYDDDDKRVLFEFENRLDTHLRDFAGNFTQYQVKQIKQLKSRYAIRLYEILRKSHPIKTKKKSSYRILQLGELRAMLGAFGKTYESFPHFRQFVLNVAQRQLKNETDLCFDIETIRKGRKVDAVKFIIRHNKQFEVVADAEQDVEVLPRGSVATMDEGLAAMIRMQLPDVSDSELQIMATTYESDMLMEALLDLARVMATGQIKTTPAQYFKGILKNKRQEDQGVGVRQGKTTEQKLTDRSWAEGLNLNDEDETA